MDENTIDYTEATLKGMTLALDLAETAGDGRSAPELITAMTQRNPETWPYIALAALEHLSENVLGPTLDAMDTPEVRESAGYTSLRDNFRPAARRAYEKLAEYQDGGLT